MKTTILAAARQIKPSPIGQASFNTAGTFEWTCPPGVTRICLAMMGAGGSSTHNGNANVNSRWVGDGGNLRYQNDIDVVPGQKYTIVVPTPQQKTSKPATAFGISTADPISGNLKGADGSKYPTATPAVLLGCNAGGAVAGNNGYGFNLLTFTQVTANAPGWSTTNRVGCIPGGGAGVYNGGSSFPYFGAAGAIGAVRIIWGSGRAFPNKNIGNL